MCSDEHEQGLALVKMGLRLEAAFHGVMRSPVRCGGFVLKRLNESSQAIYCLEWAQYRIRRVGHGLILIPVNSSPLIMARLSEPNHTVPLRDGSLFRTYSRQ